MKIGILCTMRNGFGKKGFYNSQELGLARKLRELGHTVVIWKGGRRDLPRSEETPAEGVRVLYLPMPGFGVHGYFDTHLLEDVDGLFCFADNQLMLGHVMRACARRGIVFIPIFGTTVSVYTSLHGRVMNALFRLYAAPRYRRMHVLAKTPAAREELYGLGIKDVEITPVGIDDTVLRRDFRDTDKNELRARFGYTPEDVLLFSVARMELDKRPGDMVEILARVRDRKNFRLLIIGKGPLRNEVDRLIAARGLEDRVRIIESVPFDEMWQYYRMADYFLNLNRGEIFGMAIMEAMYYEVSVAAIEAMGPSVTLRDMPGHCLCADDDAVAAWICGPYPDAADLSLSAARVTERFSWKRCAEAIVRRIEQGGA